MGSRDAERHASATVGTERHAGVTVAGPIKRIHADGAEKSRFRNHNSGQTAA